MSSFKEVLNILAIDYQHNLHVNRAALRNKLKLKSAQLKSIAVQLLRVHVKHI